MQYGEIDSGRGYAIRCAYAQAPGAERVCIALHGLGSSKDSPTVHGLAQCFPAQGISVVSFDMPGHGESPVDGEYLRLSSCLGDIAAVEAHVRALAPGAEIVYFGSSFGAYLALLHLMPRGGRAFLRSAAVNLPELLCDRPQAERRALEEQGFVMFGGEYGYARPLKITRQLLDDLRSHDLFALWKPGMAELEMVHGEADETIAVSAALRFAQRNAVPITVIPGGDHSLSGPGMPEQVRKLALAFSKRENKMRGV